MIGISKKAFVRSDRFGAFKFRVISLFGFFIAKGIRAT